MDQSGGVILVITISYMGPKSGGDITQAGAKKMLTYFLDNLHPFLYSEKKPALTHLRIKNT